MEGTAFFAVLLALPFLLYSRQEIYAVAKEIYNEDFSSVLNNITFTIPAELEQFEQNPTR